MAGMLINNTFYYFDIDYLTYIFDFTIGNSNTKEYIDELLEKHNIELKNKVMYDYVFAATMCKADYLGSSIEDEQHLALYIKDTVDDIDADSSTTFRRWLATMVGNGEPIDWNEIV